MAKRKKISSKKAPSRVAKLYASPKRKLAAKRGEKEKPKRFTSSKAESLREDSPPYRVNGNGEHKKLRFIDLFCGIGGFRFAMKTATKARGIDSQCVFSSDIDEEAQTAYEANFGDRPTGDITKVAAQDVPDHDLLLGGFPCQAFSIIGDRNG